jgi:hypothetical protein
MSDDHRCICPRHPGMVQVLDTLPIPVDYPVSAEHPPADVDD